MADGSNSFLNISSHSGSIDIYVGDGASAEIHTKEGKREGKNFSAYFLLCCSLIFLSYVGAVCVRVPSSLQAAVELSGASVEISPEVVLRRAETNTCEGQTTVTGEPIVFHNSTSFGPNVLIHTEHSVSTRACFLQAISMASVRWSGG